MALQPLEPLFPTAGPTPPFQLSIGPVVLRTQLSAMPPTRTIHPGRPNLLVVGVCLYVVTLHPGICTLDSAALWDHTCC